MIQDEAERWAKELKIDPTQVVREEWELKILKILFDSSLGQKVFFKGGTALRLAFGSPRFSEDLDLSAFRAVGEEEFKDCIGEISKISSQIKVSDFKSKFYTHLAEFKISENYLPKNFSIKVEISKRKTKYRYSLRMLTSAVTNLQVLANVEELSDIYREKLAALASRKKGRDLFDIWYIAQKMKRLMPEKLVKISRREIRAINKFLPLNLRQITRELEEKYGT